MQIKHRALRAEAALWDGEMAGDWTPERTVVPRTWPHWLPAPRPNVIELAPGETGTLNKVLYVGASIAGNFICNPGDVLVHQRGSITPMSFQAFLDTYQVDE